MAAIEGFTVPNVCGEAHVKVHLCLCVCACIQDSESESAADSAEIIVISLVVICERQTPECRCLLAEQVNLFASHHKPSNSLCLCYNIR